jgi:hypothetical protein
MSFQVQVPPFPAPAAPDKATDRRSRLASVHKSRLLTPRSSSRGLTPASDSSPSREYVPSPPHSAESSPLQSGRRNSGILSFSSGDESNPSSSSPSSPIPSSSLINVVRRKHCTDTALLDHLRGVQCGNERDLDELLTLSDSGSLLAAACLCALEFRDECPLLRERRHPGLLLRPDSPRVTWAIREACGRQSAAALFLLGYFHEVGCLVTKDGLEAVRLYRAAAALDCVDAIVGLARCLEQGAGSPCREVAEEDSLLLYCRAARAGHPEAICALGRHLEVSAPDFICFRQRL